MKKILCAVICFLFLFGSQAKAEEDEFGYWTCENNGMSIVCDVIEKYDNEGMDKIREYYTALVLTRIVVNALETGEPAIFIIISYPDISYTTRFSDVFLCSIESVSFDESMTCILNKLKISREA